jgi:hypothetical protein
MKRGQVFVRGQRADGTWGNVDAFDLDDESFRAFVLEILSRAGLVAAIREKYVDGEPIPYQVRVPPGEK